MNYLLDTCVISELVKAAPSQRVVKWFEECDEAFVFLSVLSIGEIQKGIARLVDGKRKYALQRWLDKDLRDRFSERLIPIDAEVALAWGILQAESELRGSPVPTIDGLLGATALVHNLVVVTRNEADIRRTGARVLNPW